MSWIEKNAQTKTVSSADSERAGLLDKVKKEALPTIQKEAENGAPQFKPMRFQPVKSPDIYDAEFGRKNDDLIFHFWPYGFHLSQAANTTPPRFSKDFLPKLKHVMEETFGAHRIEVKEDPDMGAIFVKATGWGTSQFHRELAVKACEAVHKAMGGKS